MNNRSVMPGRISCLYYPAHSNTPGCAIGAELPKRLSKKLDKSDNSVIKYLLQKFANEFPAWMLDFSPSFLLELQDLHDESDYWDKNGLSAEGRESAASLFDAIEKSNV
jgi:hypothetical protein